MNFTHRFWPAGRKLFRQQPRLRPLMPAPAIVAGIAMAVAVGGGWQ